MAHSTAKNNIKTEIIKHLPGPLLSIIRIRRELMMKGDMKFFPRKMKRFCPCCGMRFRSFSSGHYSDHPERFNPSRYEHTSQDILCPFCWSMPRHRILALWCEQHQDLFRSSKVLYFAPEKSMIPWLKRNGISYTTADLYEEADLILDIQSTGLPDESYDMIICNHVLEHVDDFRVALKEMFRILKSGGSFICSFPMDSGIDLVDEDPSVQTAEERYRRFGQNDHKRVFGMKADQLLEETGFTVERICGDDYPEEILPVIGPAEYDMNILFRCVK